MLEQPLYTIDNDRVVELIRHHPWALLISAPAEPGGDPVVTHLPVLQDARATTPTVLSHIPNEDAELHGLGSRRTAVVVQGVHGYISPTWYEAGPYVPTWDFVVAHLHGTAHILDAEQTYQILEATCERMESERSAPWSLSSVTDYAHRIAPGVTGFRLVPDRVVGKAKMSQDKPAEIMERVAAALRRDPFHANAALADEVERARAAVGTSSAGREPTQPGLSCPGAGAPR